jgi:hypothetical protein
LAELHVSVVFGGRIKKKFLEKRNFLERGWKMGLEPTTFRTTI